MPIVYFNQNNTNVSRDGTTKERAWLNPLDIHPDGRGYNFASGTAYLFAEDTETNLGRWFGLYGYGVGITEKITVGPWGGSGDAPKLTCYRMADRTECQPAVFDADLNFLPGGTGPLWAVPRQFFGLYGGRVWGEKRDITNQAGAGVKFPIAPRHWVCGGPQAGSPTTLDGVPCVIVYSADGNPVDAYGGLFLTVASDAGYANPKEQSVVFVNQAKFGVEIFGIDISLAKYGVYNEIYSPGDLSIKLSTGYNIHHNKITDVFDAVSWYAGGSTNNGVGYKDARQTDNYMANLGCTGFRSYKVAFNNGYVARNVVNGCGYADSAGGLYLSGLYTTDDSRTLVERNTVSGAVWGRIWPHDGHGIYQEELSQQIEIRHNFVWNCDRPFINNLPRSKVLMQGNVAFVGSDPSFPMFFCNQYASRDPDAEVCYASNISIGFSSLLHFRCDPGSPGPQVRVNKNVSVGANSSAGANNYHTRAAVAINTTGSPGAFSGVRVYGADNNFYNHSMSLQNYNGGSDQGSVFSNTNLTNPAAELLKLPTPTDPRVNYALQIAPMTWGGNAPNLST